MFGNLNYIGTSLSGLTQEVKSKGKNYSVSSKRFYINEDIIVAHWVGYSVLQIFY